MRAVILVHGRRSAENLILGRHPLQVSSESLIFGSGFFLSSLKVGQLGLEILDMSFFSFAECSLAVNQNNVSISYSIDSLLNKREEEKERNSKKNDVIDAYPTLVCKSGFVPRLFYKPPMKKSNGKLGR